MVYYKWRTFENFFSDMGHPPSKDHSLDRIDNNQGYHPENCRWILKKDQAKNTRRSIIVTVKGVSMCMRDASRALGVSYDILRRRYKKGEGTAEAIANKVLAALPKDEK